MPVNRARYSGDPSSAGRPGARPRGSAGAPCACMGLATPWGVPPAGNRHSGPPLPPA